MNALSFDDEVWHKWLDIDSRAEAHNGAEKAYL